MIDYVKAACELNARLTSQRNWLHVCGAPKHDPTQANFFEFEACYAG